MDSVLQGLFYKTIVVKARRWSYRLTYGIVGDVVWVHYLYPSWHPETHSGLARRRFDDEEH